MGRAAISGRSGVTVMLLAVALAAADRRGEAAAIGDELDVAGRHALAGVVRWMLGEPERALAAFEQFPRELTPVVVILSAPRLIEILRDGRFISLLRRMGHHAIAGTYETLSHV